MDRKRCFSRLDENSLKTFFLTSAFPSFFFSLFFLFFISRQVLLLPTTVHLVFSFLSFLFLYLLRISRDARAIRFVHKYRPLRSSYRGDNKRLEKINTGSIKVIARCSFSIYILILHFFKRRRVWLCDILPHFFRGLPYPGLRENERVKRKKGVSVEWK